MHQRVVISGIGVICGAGKQASELWEQVIAGQSGIAEMNNLDADWNGFRNAAEVKSYNPLDYFTPKQLDLLDPFAQFQLIAAREAVINSGVILADLDKPRVGVITGTSIGGQNSNFALSEAVILQKQKRTNPLAIPRAMPNAGASHISMEFGFTGPAFTVSTACSSSNHAIGHAFWMVRAGLIDYAITGGSETPLTFSFLKAWDAIRVVSSTTCRPFTLHRPGMILGEGAGALFIETLASAQQRNAPIYAEIIGFGMSSDAGHITRPVKEGAEAAMRAALQDANLPPEKIDYINAHGTGTIANDSMETAAIHAVFGDHSKKLAVSSTKPIHGHMLGATSAVECLITSLALHHQILPPTANFTEADPDCDLDYVPNQARPATIQYAMSNSFAFGGLNAALVLKRWVP